MNNARLLRQDALDLLRFPLAVVVVIVHTFSYEEIVVSGIQYKVSEYSIFCDAHLFVDAFLRRISVPIYFFISGYVFFAGVKFNIDVYKQKIKNRIKTLLIPYVIWNALAVFLIIFKQLPIFEPFLSYDGSALNLSLRSILNCFWIYDGGLNPHPVKGLIVGQYEPINISLWYLRDLMVIVASTPLIYLLVKRFKTYSVYLFLVVYIISLALNFPISSIAGGFFYFSWGAYMSIYNIDMMVAFNKYFKLSVVMYLICGFTYMMFSKTQPVIVEWILIIKAIFALFACFNFAAYLLQNTSLKVSTFLASSSFFIYVSHYIFVGRLRKVLFMILKPDTGIEILAIYIYTVIILVLTLLLLFFLLKRYCPSVLKILVGRK